MRLTKLKEINTASFKNYSWITEVPDFCEKNIILGWNGTGKTVLSRVLRSLEKNQIFNLPDDSQFKLEINQKIIDDTKINGLKNKIKVFNEDYVREITSVGLLPHIFYLGEKAVDYSGKEKELKELNNKLKNCKNEHAAISESIAKNIKSLAGIANLKKELQKGVYNTYDKRSFELRINEIKEKIKNDKIDISKFKLSEKNIKQAQNQIAQQFNKIREYNLLKKADDWIDIEQKKIKQILFEKITFNSSDRINSYPRGSKEYSWIKDGVSIHNLNDEKHRKNKCIFCNSNIRNDDELIKHFTSDVIELNKNIEDYLEEINVFKNSISQTDFTFYSEEADKLSTFFKSLKNKLNHKKNNPDKEYILETSQKLVSEKIANNTNFNDIAHKIERHYVAEVYSDYTSKKNSFESCEAEQEKLGKLISKCKREIQELKAKAKNAHRPAEMINKVIKITFPYKKIEVRESDDGIGYFLYRNNNTCNFYTLSEGERNFVALAYFLISLNTIDEDNSLSKQGIVVIDDPVSSLDKNSIFQIFSIISNEIEVNLKRQYFILTHNLEFFSHLHDHFKNKIRDDKVRLYQINLDDDGSNLTEIHPLLKQFKSDYHYSVRLLWDNRESCSIEDSYLIVNLIRRVWETFLHFKFSSNGSFKSLLEKAYREAANIKLEKLPDSVPDNRIDEIKSDFRSDFNLMYRFTNYGSHEYGNIDTIDESILLKSKDIIKNFFDVIELLDKYHFKKITTQ